MRLLVIAASPGFPARPPKNIDEAFETMPATADDSLQVKGEATTGLGKPLTEFGPEHSVSPKLQRNDKVMQFLHHQAPAGAN